ncbi:MAG: hypothetical protein AB1Z19_03415 [Eubacteriales bacterium]
MPKRYDAQVFFETDLDYTNAKKYINAQRKAGHNISFMSMLIAAYIRTVSEMPALNRFIMAKKIFARNELTVSFAIIRADGTQEDSMETTTKVWFCPTDTIYQVAEKINNTINENRKMNNANITDKLASFFMGIPLVPGALIAFVKGLDKVGLLPKAILDGSPFHTSMFITNMASINLGAVHHHVYEFGTTSVFIGMGKMQDKTQPGGPKKRVIPIGVVVDERIAAGITFARGFNMVKRYLAHPELLEAPPEKVTEDIR